MEDFNVCLARLELLELLAEAENDVINGCVAPMNDTIDELRNLLNEE